MRTAVLAFVAGATILQLSPSLAGRGTLAALLCAAALSAYLWRSLCWRALGAGLLGYCWAALVAHMALGPSLAAADEGRDVQVVGIVDNLPFDFGQGQRFNFRIERVLSPGVVPPPCVALSWYGGSERVAPGERWRLTVRLQRPHGNANPHGFDYEAWLLEQGVRATGYVRQAPGNLRLDAFVATPGTVVERTREAVRARILSALAGREYAPVIVALAIGDQRGIAQSDWAVFNRTGVSHLISISGLHITMVAGLAAWAVSALWRRSFFTNAQLPLLLPAQKAAALAGASVTLLYVLLAGFGVPAQRTFYMLSVVAIALWTGRIAGVTHVLCAALGLVVLLDPWAMLWPGFWLSFGAVGVILYASAGRIGPRQRGRRAALRAAARTQYAVTVGLVPLTLLLFSQVSLASPLANALAIPVVSFVVTPLALAGALLPAPLAAPPLLLAHAVVDGLARVLGWMGAWPLAVWSAPAPPPWLFAFALLGTAWALAPRGWPHRWTGFATWLPLLALQPSHPPPGSMWVTAFDVGQGMALLVETSSHRLLYDTGPAYAPGADGGGRVIAPYLRARGIGALDGMIISHSDSDHAGGALTLLAAVKTGWVASSLRPGSAIVKAAPQHIRCAAGQRWRWDGVEFEMLQPSVSSYADHSLKSNARSCTLRISASGRSILLAGDIEAAQEAKLLEGGAGRLRSDVLLAPHHGSGTSSTAAFLEAVHPQVAIFQVGYRNRYHHPKMQVYERYGTLGAARYRTDESGALALRLGPGGISVAEYRREHARYWHGR